MSEQRAVVLGEAASVGRGARSAASFWHLPGWNRLTASRKRCGGVGWVGLGPVAGHRAGSINLARLESTGRSSAWLSWPIVPRRLDSHPPSSSAPPIRTLLVFLGIAVSGRAAQRGATADLARARVRLDGQ
jgi:hypothetical protein